MNYRVRKRILIAFFLSVFLHITFLVWSYFVRILPAIPFAETTERVFHVRIDKRESLGEEKLKFDAENSQKTLKQTNRFSQEMPVSPSVESEQLIKNNIESSIEKSKEAIIPSSIQQNQILKKSELNDIIVTKKVRRSVRENLVELGEIPNENFSSGSPVLISGEEVSKNFIDRSAVMNNSLHSASLQAANRQNEFQVMKKHASGLEYASKAMDLGTALTYELFKYRSALGQKYFKLVVKVRDATIDFPVIPKEIIYLIDASGSIGMDRLKQEKQGLAYSLMHLNPHDRFNIIAFKDKNYPLSPNSLDNTPDNIKMALKFLNDLKSWSTTDLYGALKMSIDVNDPFVPSYRVVMTDGFPTTGVIDARRVINEISKDNDNRVSFFTFGGGSSVDPYMLDFIAFKNRGWSRVAEREQFMAREFDNLYNEIKDPLLLNVRYYVSGLDAQEIFPQTMPDFFKGSQFVIYGKYTDENRFALQVRGDTTHDTKEFIVSAALDDATIGTPEIAHDWAFHKVYYLISQLKYNENNQALLGEISNLCTQYHIITPYSISFHVNHAVSAPKKLAVKVKPAASLPVAKK